METRTDLKPGSPRRGRGGAARTAFCLAVLPAVLGIAGCTRDNKFQAISMWNESRIKPMEASPLAGELSSARSPVPGTVARGTLPADDPILTGRGADGKLVTKSPIRITPVLLQRGQERFNIYCAPCHSRVGDGEGMIVQRSFPHPPDYAIPRLRNAAIGHFFDVITNGYGVMYSYAERVPVTDRWAIASYIRVLQAARPVVLTDPYATERERARESGIQDPSRPMRLEGGGEEHAVPTPAPGSPVGPNPAGPGTSEHPAGPGAGETAEPVRGGSTPSGPNPTRGGTGAGPQGPQH